jgi:hypothetical protein
VLKLAAALRAAFAAQRQQPPAQRLQHLLVGRLRHALRPAAA